MISSYMNKLLCNLGFHRLHIDWVSDYCNIVALLGKIQKLMRKGINHIYKMQD